MPVAASPVSTVLLVAFVAISLWGLWRSPALVDRCLLRPSRLFRGGPNHPLITSGFVHADLAHLVFNAFTFWSFAWGLERVIGSERLLVLYLLALLGGNLGTWWRHRSDPSYRSLGASGAILGVLFASILYFPGASLYILPLPVPIPAPVFAVGYLAYSVWASRQARGRVNHDAHLAGALVGVLFVAATDPGVVRAALERVLPA